ncbi:CORVET complex subunit [Saccharomycopsis crataegensis]|uniref:CORVET complex subunit n=1 Tax=Saccharomycopsis crataegensis TaxID=43959 RepID=A0AAV5QRH7_9ASCO|nr:CORVET complex subunit [Saccharomycopsis crataegensis]
MAKSKKKGNKKHPKKPQNTEQQQEDMANDNNTVVEVDSIDKNSQDKVAGELNRPENQIVNNPSEENLESSDTNANNYVFESGVNTDDIGTSRPNDKNIDNDKKKDIQETVLIKEASEDLVISKIEDEEPVSTGSSQINDIPNKDNVEDTISEEHTNEQVPIDHVNKITDLTTDYKENNLETNISERHSSEKAYIYHPTEDDGSKEDSLEAYITEDHTGKIDEKPGDCKDKPESPIPEYHSNEVNDLANNSEEKAEYIIVEDRSSEKAPTDNDCQLPKGSSADDHQRPKSPEKPKMNPVSENTPSISIGKETKQDLVISKNDPESIDHMSNPTPSIDLKKNEESEISNDSKDRENNSVFKSNKTQDKNDSQQLSNTNDNETNNASDIQGRGDNESSKKLDDEQTMKAEGDCDIGKPQPLEEVKISPGPFSIDDLISGISLNNPEIPESENSAITCVAAFEENIYIGTKHGEILHYYKLDCESGYLPISRQRVHLTKIKPIKNILLLPQVNKALILNGSMINVFSLPELSPANIGKIKDVNDMTIDVDNFFGVEIDPSVGVPVVLFTKKMIRVISVTQDSLKLVKDISYPHTIKGLRRSKFSLVATRTNYDLIDIDSFQKIPLLPMSTTGEVPHEDIEPFIFPISKHEYLITCGSSKADPAMGMIVNNNGDISRGTIPWRTYPDTIAVNYPYTIAVLENQENDNGYKYEVSVHSINDQCDVQKMEFTDEVKLATVTKVFEEEYQPLLNVISSVSLITQEPNKPLLTEEIEELCKIKSSILIYNPKSGKIRMIKTLPTLSRLQAIVESHNFNELQKEYDDFVKQYVNENTSTVDISKEDKVTFSFLKEALGLSFILNNRLDYGFRFWINQYDDLDTQMLLKLDNIGIMEDFDGNDEKKMILCDLQLRPNPRVIIYFFYSLMNNAKDNNVDLLAKYFNFKSIDIRKGLLPFANHILANCTSDSFLKFYLRVLMNWLENFHKLIGLNRGLSSKSNESGDDSVAPQPSPSKRSNSFDQQLESHDNVDGLSSDTAKRGDSLGIIRRNGKSGSSDTNVAPKNIYSSTPNLIYETENSHPAFKLWEFQVKTSDIEDKDLENISSPFVMLNIKEIELVLLKYYIDESMRTKSDKDLLAFINGNIRICLDETIQVLTHSGKYSVILKIYESLKKPDKFFKLWMALMNGELIDESSFPINSTESFRKYQIRKINDKILFGDQPSTLGYIEYFKFLINIGEFSTVITNIFDPKLLDKLDEIEILKTIDDDITDSMVEKNFQNSKCKTVNDLKISYLEYLLDSVSSKRTALFGKLVFEYVDYLIDIVSKNREMFKRFMGNMVENYKSLKDFPKVSIDSYFKIRIKTMSKNNQDGNMDRDIMVRFYDVNAKLLGVLRTIDDAEKVTIIELANDDLKFHKRELSRSKTLEKIYDQFSKFQNIFLIDLINIDGYLNHVDKTVEHLTSVGDFVTAEKFISTNGKVLFNKNFQHQEKVIDDEKMKELLLKLYKIYVKDHVTNQKLIENFLLNYSQFIDFNVLLDNIPESALFSMKFVSNTILMKNLIDVNDRHTMSLTKKNLARSELNFYNRILREFKSTQ